MKNYLLLGSFIFFTGFSLQVLATGGFQSGAGLTTGPSSSHFSLFGASSNPAMNALLVDEGEEWRFAFAPSVSFTSELGEVGDFIDELDDLVDFIGSADFLDVSLFENLERFNNVVLQMGESGYIKADFNSSIPLLPSIYKSEVLGGSISLNLSYNLEAGARVLDDPIEIDVINGVTTATSLYIRSATESVVSIGYGRELFTDHEWFQDGYSFYAGVKLNLMSLQLSKQVIPLVSIINSDVLDVLRDQYDESFRRNLRYGIDVGFVLDAKNYRLGFTAENLNAQTSSFRAIGGSCVDTEVGPERNSCLASNIFIGEERIQAEEVFIREARMRVDALYKLNSRWHVSAAYDLNEYRDVAAFDNQWFYASSSFDINSFFIPSLRLGYKKNLVGTELSSLAFGVSLLKYVNLDFEYGLESVSDNLDSSPRRFGFAISVEERF